MRIFKRIVPLFLLLFLLVSCSPKNDKVIGSCAGYDVLYEELRYTVQNCKKEMADLYGEDIWNSEKNADAYKKELKERVTVSLEKDYTLLAAAADLLPSLSPECEELAPEVEKNLEEAVESFGGKSEYKSALKELNLTEHFLRVQIGRTLIQMRLQDLVSDGTYAKNEETLLSYLDGGNYRRVQKIVVSIDQNHHVLPVMEQAKRLQKDAVAGTLDLSSLGENVSVSPPSYYYRGLGSENEETLIFGLQNVGDVSEVTQIDGGYGFFIRLDDEREFMVNNQLSTLLDRYREKQLADVLILYAKDVAFVWNEDGKSIDLLSVK